MLAMFLTLLSEILPVPSPLACAPIGYVGPVRRDMQFFRDVAKEIGTPEDKVVLVEHMLISHHGKPEFGAAVPPKFLEAIILSKLDELDATIYEVCETYTNVEAGEFSSRLWNFDNIALYNPGRADHPEPVAKLFDTED